MKPIRWILATMLLAVCWANAPALATDTISLYADFGGDEELARTLFTKPGTPFDVVVVTDTSHGGTGIEFIMTDLVSRYAGVFKVSTTVVNGSNLNIGNPDLGEYVLAYRACIETPQTEVLRVRYHDVGGTLGDNVVLSLRGFGPGDSVPSTFSGQMGYVDCMIQGRVLEPAPWEPVAGFDPLLLPEVTSSDGILVLNPVNNKVAAATASMSTLKSRF